MTEKEFLITETKANEILDYLKKKPFDEVAHLVQTFLNLKPMNPPALTEVSRSPMKRTPVRAPLKPKQLDLPNTKPTNESTQ